jgi:hypothetical protein
MVMDYFGMLHNGKFRAMSIPYTIFLGWIKKGLWDDTPTTLSEIVTQSSHRWFHHVIIKAIVIDVMSYDVLMNGAFLYPIGFTLGFWNKTTFYKLGWQSRNAKSVHLPIHFIGNKPLSQNNMMPSFVSFFEIVNFGGELLESNVSS